MALSLEEKIALLGDGLGGSDIYVLHANKSKPLTGLIDASGRPIREIHADPIAVEGLEMDLRKCPFHGSRKNHRKPMNLAAQRPLNAAWPVVLRYVDRARDIMLMGKEQDAIDIHTAWRIARSIDLLPWWVVRRKDNAVKNGELDPRLAAVYKVFLGSMAVLEGMSLEAIVKSLDPDLEDVHSTTGEAINAWAEENGVFIGPEQVCAGPPNMVIEVMSVLIDGMKDRPPIDAERKAILDDWVGDEERFKEYVYASVELDVVRMVTRVFRRLVFQDLDRVLSDLEGFPEESRSAFRDLEVEIKGHPLTELTADLDDEDRGALADYLTVARNPDPAAWDGECFVRAVDSVGVLWAEDRSARTDAVHEMVKGASVLDFIGADRWRILVDRLIVFADLQSIVMEVIREGEKRVRHALGAEEKDVPLTTEIAEMETGKNLGDFSSRHLHLYWWHLDDEVLFSMGGSSVRIPRFQF
jgi:hypothetical protein